MGSSVPAGAPAHELPGGDLFAPDRFEIDDEGRVWLRGSRCPRCGRYAFPPREWCPRCRRRGTEPVRLGREARLYSFTVCETAPSGWRAPYLQAYVELPEGVRAFTLVADEVEPRADALEVGIAMEPVAEPLGPEDRRLTYKFRPVAGGEGGGGA